MPTGIVGTPHNVPERHQNLSSGLILQHLPAAKIVLIGLPSKYSTRIRNLLVVI